MLFKDPNIDTIKQMSLNILKFSYEGLQKEMPEEKFNQALAYVNNELRLPVSKRIFEIILASDGYAYANIIEYGTNDTEARGSISNAVAKHYMHRPWPMNLEKGDPGMDDFEERLLAKVLSK
jgi:hypothetical protein